MPTLMRKTQENVGYPITQNNLSMHRSLLCPRVFQQRLGFKSLVILANQLNHASGVTSTLFIT